MFHIIDILEINSELIIQYLESWFLSISPMFPMYRVSRANMCCLWGLCLIHFSEVPYNILLGTFPFYKSRKQ